MNGAVQLPLDLAELTITASGGSLVRRTVLPSGVRILSEQVPGSQSATVGYWVAVGSRDEQPVTYGSTHFLEHLLFKGTSTRTALDIAVSFDSVGGEHNAMTAKEYTCYYAKVRDRDLPMAVEVLADMFTSSLLDVDEFEAERGVILEELAMADDDPSDVVSERFFEAVFGEHPLGRPIGGTVDTIEAVGPEDIVEHYRRHYLAPGLVVTGAGGLDHDELCAQVLAAIGRSPWAPDPTAAPLPRRPLTSDVSGAPAGRVLVVRRQIEQANVVLGTTGLTATDPRRYVMSVLNAVLGGGMSSRLFQEIREKRGLAYSVYSFASGHSDSGYFGLYAGCAPGKVDEVVTLLRAGLESLAADGVSEEELARALGQICGGMVLGLEDSGSRMSRLGKAELVHGEFVSLDESLRRVRAVTAEQVQKLAVELAARPRSLAVVGPFDIDRTFPAVGE